MNVLHVSYLDVSGRRFNGYDLIGDLAGRGIEGSLAVREKSSRHPRVTQVLEGPADAELQHAAREVEARHSLNNVLFPWGRVLERSAVFEAADIVHYHIIHQGFISIVDLPRLSAAKRSVWTFHDPWPLTGHCVHPEDCTGWLTGCTPCPHLDREFPMREDRAGAMWELKRETYERVDADVVVASEFMLDMVRRSPLAAPFERVHHIRFGVDTAAFTPEHDRTEARRRLGIPSDEFVLFFRSTDWPLKGLTYILDALGSRQPLRPTTLLTVERRGLLAPLAAEYRLRELGWIGDETLYPLLFAACDAFLMPSTAESFGLMALEAMASGRPVICFANTAVESVTHAPECGLAAAWRDAAALRDAIDLLASDPTEAERRGRLGREIAEREYGHERYLDAMTALYERVAAR